MSAPDYAQYSPKILLALMEAFSNRISFVNWILLFLLPYRGHGSLRGRKGPPQHLVRSTGAAMSTTGSHGSHAAQGPPSQSPAPSPRRATITSGSTPGWMLVSVTSDGGRLLGPAEWLPRPPHAVQDHG